MTATPCRRRWPTAAGRARGPILELRGLAKNYGPVQALKPANLAFNYDEIHAIVGENGAGKSTLIKLLTGVIRRTGGEIFWNGKPVALDTPQEAIDHGINAVHQEVVLCRHLSVAANIFLGDEKVKFGLLQKREMTRAAQTLLDDMGFNLPAGETARQSDHRPAAAGGHGARLAARHQIPDLRRADGLSHAAGSGAAVRADPAPARQGVTIVYISHRLEEVFELADRVSVLRDGNLVGTRNIKDTNENELVALMINRSLEQIYHKEQVPHGEVLLETRNLCGKGFEDVSISVRRGEIVGLYGLIGAGRSEFVMSVFGRNPKTAGEILWKGQPVDIRNERQAIGLGIALAPESRRDQGLNLNLPIGFNINLPIYDRLTHGITISPREEAEHADKQIARSRDQDAEPALARLLDVGRQPAEDRHRQMAQPRRRSLHLRRADSGRRCRHQGRNLPAARRSC